MLRFKRGERGGVRGESWFVGAEGDQARYSTSREGESDEGGEAGLVC